MSDRIVLVGELNPYGADPGYALFPSPDGSSGHRLCCLVLGMRRNHYLSLFDRVNLCAGSWKLKVARAKAAEISLERDRAVLCGSKVCAAFGLPFEPFTRATVKRTSVVILPHPSGLCRLWNHAAFLKAAKLVRELAPELSDFIPHPERKAPCP